MKKRKIDGTLIENLKKTLLKSKKAKLATPFSTFLEKSKFLYSMKNFLIRKATFDDIAKLQVFFIKAYGTDTIFQNEFFLSYYFNSDLSGKPTFNNCIIAFNEKNEIIAHYGGLEYQLRTNKIIRTLIWGVNAYTLPEYRGKGINSKIIEFIGHDFEVNGVIGFSYQTSLFYDTINYNIFNFEKFSRHVFVIDKDRTSQIIRYINRDNILLINLIEFQIRGQDKSINYNILQLTSINIENLELNLYEDFLNISTTNRTKKFLKWRFLENPYINYLLFGIIENNKLIAYIALRFETLDPFNFRITRIIDLFGKRDVIHLLLNKAIETSIAENHIYLDFSKFGIQYNSELDACGFIHLKNNDYCVLPQVTCPIENRDNYEFIGLKSILHSGEINKLSASDVYFTRVDSDRDRLANINQILNDKSDESE